MRRSKSHSKVTVGDYQHKHERRKNNPSIGLVKDNIRPSKKTYYPEIDPHDSPILLFNGRDETDKIDVDVVPLHVHESVHPSAILDPVIAKKSTLDDFFGNTRPHNEAVEFYEHEDGWTNRIIAGDSLLVMTSLLEKENMAGRLQMFYFDPPYGIKYNSNFQSQIFDTHVKDDVHNIEKRPEPIKAFRDSWSMGIHSYLAMVRKRLTLARELLADTGSIFVQISTKNQHLVRLLLDEVFGPENFMWQILFRTKGGGGVGDRPNPYDYILWYAKNKENVKFNRLWQDRTDKSIQNTHKQIHLKNGSIITAPKDGNLPKGSRRCSTIHLDSQGESTTDRSKPHTFPNGKTYSIPAGSQWRLGHDALDVLYNQNRVYFGVSRVYRIEYPEDSPQLFLNIWEGTQLSSKNYVVETKSIVVQNCMLMASDVGDLVMDITGGSGVTAHVAEQWGRRWITCDTSRISLATIRCRLQTATYPWYKLVNNDAGVDAGFQYETQVRLTAKSLSSDESETPIVRYDKPKTEDNRSRVTGPFTVESIPSPVIHNENNVVPVRDNLLSSLATSGITTKTTPMRFDKIEKNSDNTSPIHAYAYNGDQKTAISFGPDHGPMGKHQVDQVLVEISKTDKVLFFAMAFDPVAKSTIDKTTGAQTVLINNDVLVSELKTQSTDQPFNMVGEPDVEISKKGKNYVVKIRGYDYYDPIQDKVVPGTADNIAMWMLDTDYDGRTLRVKQLFFPTRPNLWKNLKDTLRSEIDSELLEKYSDTTSIPFEMGHHKRIAVKIIDTSGNESLTVRGLAKW